MKPKLDLSHLVDAAAEDSELLASVDQREKTQELMQRLLTTLAEHRVPQVVPHVAPAITVQPSKVVVQSAPTPTPVLDWTFTFDRNNDGTIKSIRACATKE